ncbi:MAG: hypothetical protein ACOC0N_08325 [Chroococcales cyanobacterium]
MIQNLLTAGVINPLRFPVKQLYSEVAAILNISESRIEYIEPWHYQLWVKIKGVGGKFVSYRRLQMWGNAVLEAIATCTTKARLDELANLFRIEIDRYGKQYDPKIIDRMRQVWGDRNQFLKAEEERLQPIKAQEEAAYSWQEGWLNIIPHCDSLEVLKIFVSEVQRQSSTFASVAGILQPIEQLYSARWQELAQVT